MTSVADLPYILFGSLHDLIARLYQETLDELDELKCRESENSVRVETLSKEVVQAKSTIEGTHDGKVR